MKEIEDDTNRCKDIPRSWIERINIVKMIYYTRQSTDSVQSLSMAFFTELEQKI